jgi:deoxyribodipyrimidine photo-lyase
MSQLDTRNRKLNTVDFKSGRVVYCATRDLRVEDNYALLFAQELAIQHNTTLSVVYVLSPQHKLFSGQQYLFLCEGLEEFEKKLAEHGIEFKLCFGTEIEQIEKLVKEGVGAIVTDFSPLRYHVAWKQECISRCTVPLYEVDAHNVIPVWTTSPKQEFAAYTIRPKIYRLLDEYLTDIPQITKEKGVSKIIPSTNWEGVRTKYGVAAVGSAVGGFRGGATAAQDVLSDFIKNKLQSYAILRNDPNLDAQSNLSPYINFGFMSRTRIALSVCKALGQGATSIIDAQKNGSATGENAAAFLEELIVRAELAENFCFYNPNYDNTLCFADWAQKTHAKHRGDEREFVYTLKQFEIAETHDPLWNAAQNQMLRTGKMHGFMRMYWAKKILEWTESPEEAMRIAVYLNDTYSLDGRDPNGYAGIAWSIGGVHDRAWFERPVFGQIRYMNYNGCKRKFNVTLYENTWNSKENTQKELF